MQVILKGSAVVCDGCETPVVRCDGCGKGFVCRECGEGDYCRESDQATCEACMEKEHAYWRWYFGASVHTNRDARRDLDLPADASDAEVMEAARGLK